MSKSLDPDQAGHFVSPDLDPNCLQRLLADNTCMQRHEFTISLSMFNECEARVKIWMFQSTR